MKKYLVLLLITHIAFSFPGNTQKTYSIQFAPNAGEQYLVKMATVTRMAQNVMGTDMSMQLSFDADITYDIAKAHTNTLLAITYNTLKMSMDVMGQSITMDSEDTDTTKLESKVFRQLKGSVIKVMLDPSGKVVKIEGADSILNKFEGEDRQTVEGVFSNEYLTSMIDASFGFYPTKRVKIGDTWNSGSSITTPCPINLANTYTLTEVQGTVATIDISSDITTPPNTKLIQAGQEFLVDLTGKATSVSTLNIGTGMPLRSLSTQKYRGNLEMADQKIPIAVSVETEVNFSKLK